MSIVSTSLNARPMELRGMANSQVASVVSALMETNGFEICVCDGCDFTEVAYVKNGGEWWQKDWKSFIYSRRFASDTITFTLLKDGVQVAVLNDGTYGTYYNFGSASLVNPDYKGYILEWLNVQAAFGYGQYVVRTTHNSLGTDYVYDSHPFDVVEYNAERAVNSVRVEWYQMGSIASGFDYTGIGWGQSLRINGYFGKKTPKLELDYYQDINRDRRQIQATNNSTYSLSTELLPSYIFDVLNEDTILANDIYITDYNLLNTHPFRRFNVAIESITDAVHQNFSKRMSFTYEFTKKRLNVLKRNIEGDTALLPLRLLNINVEVAAQSGVLFDFPVGCQYTSYRTGDEGWRVQNGYFDYTPPPYPEVIAELDRSLGANAWWQLKNPLRVGGVSNTLRFVDVNGVQGFGAANNVDEILIDKLTATGYYRTGPTTGNWNDMIDAALALSIVVNGVTFDSFFLQSSEEYLKSFGIKATAGSDIKDNITNVVIMLGSTGELFFTSTTYENPTTLAVTHSYDQLTTESKSSAVRRGCFVFDARSLITA